MAKNTSASRERRERAQQLALAQKKKERIILISAIAALVVIIAVATIIIIMNLPKDETTNTVCINVTHTDANGKKHTGDIIVELDPENAPITVANFKKLVSEGFYDGLVFHRIIEGFMIQGGGFDTSMNEKDADTIKGEFSANGVDNGIKHVRGTISMARTSVYNSASSQFFIVHQDSVYLDGQYSSFGYTVYGMDVVDEIASIPTDYSDRPKIAVRIKKVTII